MARSRGIGENFDGLQPIERPKTMREAERLQEKDTYREKPSPYYSIKCTACHPGIESFAAQIMQTSSRELF